MDIALHKLHRSRKIQRAGRWRGLFEKDRRQDKARRRWVVKGFFIDLFVKKNLKARVVREEIWFMHLTIFHLHQLHPTDEGERWLASLGRADGSELCFGCQRLTPHPDEHRQPVCSLAGCCWNVALWRGVVCKCSPRSAASVSISLPAQGFHLMQMKIPSMAWLRVSTWTPTPKHAQINLYRKPWLAHFKPPVYTLM